MITLHDFRDQTRHLPPDSVIGISWDEECGQGTIVLRDPDSKGAETVVDCGILEPVGSDEEG